jgi:hypothetical protein
MGDNPHNRRNGAPRRCAICNGQFGLVRHYSWRTALCSRKCVERFKTRREVDHKWIHRFQAV